MSSVTAFGSTVTAPVAGPTITSAGTSSGSMTIGLAYSYKVTFVSQFGETNPGPASSSTASTTGSMALTGIPTFSGVGVTGRRIYRTQAGNGGVGPWLLLTALSDNLATSYVDSASDVSLGGAAPTANTASSVEVVGGYTKRFAPPINISAAVVATGATLATAAPVPVNAAVILVTTAAGTGVSLQPLALSLLDLEVTVKNLSAANTLNVFPASASDNINALAGGAAFVLAASASVKFHATQNGANFTWVTI